MAGMDTLALFLFIASAFVASLVAGLAGFAFGLIAASLWLYLLTPAQTTTLIVAFGLVVQGVSVWKLRHAIKLARLLPFVVGSAVGVPIGVEVLRWIAPAHMRAGIGGVLIVYSLYALLRPRLGNAPEHSPAADGIVGVLGGVLGGATGLAGIIVTIWSGHKPWSKDEQRAVFQPVGVATFFMTAVWLGGAGLLVRESVLLFLVGLPAVLAGIWLGLRLYGRLDEAGFRTVVLSLLLVSGVILVLGAF